MKNNLQKIITTVFLLTLFCIFSSCVHQVAKVESENQSEVSENGIVKVNMFVPNYDLISENARAIAPQTESVKFSYKIGDDWTSFDAVELSSATATKIENAEEGLFGNTYSLTFKEIPCGTYAAGTLKVELLDSDKSVVTSGTNNSKVIISKALTAKAEFYTIPTDFVSLGEENSIEKGKMQFFSISLDANNAYAFQLTIKEEYTAPDVVIFNSDGTYNSYITGSSIDFVDDGIYYDYSESLKTRYYKSGFFKKFDKADSTQNYYIGIYAKDDGCSYTAYLSKSKYFKYNTWSSNSEDTEALQDSEGNYYVQDYECNFSWADLGLDSNYIPIKGDKINVQFSLFLEDEEDFFKEEYDEEMGNYKVSFFKSTNFRSYASEDNWYLNLSDWQSNYEITTYGSYHSVLSRGEYIENEGFSNVITYTIENYTKATNTDSLAFDIILSPKDGETIDNNRGQIPFWVKSISATVDKSGRNNKVTVTYNAGENATSSITSEELYSGQNLNATASCENKFFVGWSKTEGDKDSVITVAPDEDCTLYAVYDDELELTPDWGGSRIPFSWFENYENAYLTVDITHKEASEEQWCGIGTNWSGNIIVWDQTYSEETTESVKFLVSDILGYYDFSNCNEAGEAAIYLCNCGVTDNPTDDTVYHYATKVYLTYDDTNCTKTFGAYENDIPLNVGDAYQIKYFIFPQTLSTENISFSYDKNDSDDDIVNIDEKGLVTAKKEGEAHCFVRNFDSEENKLCERDYKFTVTSETSTSE